VQTENLGFGAANNIGISYALEQGAEHLFLLNQDAYLVEDALEQLLRFQQNHADYGILSPIHLTGSQQKLDINFSNYMLKEKTGQFYSDFVLGHLIQDVYEVPFVNAASWLVSKTCLETIGGFDPLFFHYGEDNNYCQRLVFHGYKIGVIPSAFIIHDRLERSRKIIPLFSKKYYEKHELNYKIEFADVTKDDVESQIKAELIKLKKHYLFDFVKLRFKSYQGFLKKYKLLSNIREAILYSYYKNKKKEDFRYLDFSKD